MGLKVRPPHVNYSTHQFSVRRIEQDQTVLYMGLDQVRELTRRTIDRIIQNAPFHSLEDFLARGDPRVQEAVNLARVGALAGFATIPSILQRVQNGNWQKDQMSLFAWNDSNEDDWTLEQKVAEQQELLGASLEAHPLELVADKIANRNLTTTAEAVERVRERVTVACSA